jgi:hypothetical protein
MDAHAVDASPTNERPLVEHADAAAEAQLW